MVPVWRLQEMFASLGTAALESIFESSAIDDAALNAAVALTCLSQRTSKSTFDFEDRSRSLPTLKVVARCVAPASVPQPSCSLDGSIAADVLKDSSEASDTGGARTPSTALAMRPTTPGGAPDHHPADHALARLREVADSLLLQTAMVECDEEKQLDDKSVSGYVRPCPERPRRRTLRSLPCCRLRPGCAPCFSVPHPHSIFSS